METMKHCSEQARAEQDMEGVRDFLIGNTSTGTKVDRVRHLVNDLEWSVTEQ